MTTLAATLRRHATDGIRGFYLLCKPRVTALIVFTAAIGALLARVPAPLGFGTVRLEDGPCLGFLAEAAGVEGATEISALGDWRAWLAAQRR